MRVREDGSFVLYWMIAARRARWNFALQRAVEHAVRLGKPLVVLEALRAGYRWASERLHAFVIEGMADNARAFAATPVTYLPYVEPEPGAGKGMLEALAARACVVVTDDAPVFFLPRMVAAAAARLPVLLEAVDGNGLLPLRATEAVFPTAFAFRRFLQGVLPAHLEEPRSRPAGGCPPPAPRRRCPGRSHGAGRRPRRRSSRATRRPWRRCRSTTAWDASPRHAAGSSAGLALLGRFLDERLAGYAEDRNHPEREGTSGLSPYLHFGHVSAHEVFAAVAEREGWTAERLASEGERQARGLVGDERGRRGVPRPAGDLARARLQLRRQARRRRALRVAARRGRARRSRSTPATRGRTSTPLEQLEARGHARPALERGPGPAACARARIHNYLRMLWGKKILEWSPTPQDALAVMLELNNRYALDGRDPNSASGIFWCLGRYDRPWGPERPIFGTVRYMSSENTARKLRVAEYIARYSP